MTILQVLSNITLFISGLKCPVVTWPHFMEVLQKTITSVFLAKQVIANNLLIQLRKQWIRITAIAFALTAVMFTMTAAKKS